MHVLCFTTFVNQTNMSVDDFVAQQMVHNNQAEPATRPDRVYTFNSAEGSPVRCTVTQLYREYIPH